MAKSSWNKRNILFITGIFLISVILSWSAFHLLPFLGITERWLGDFSVAALHPPEKQHPDIIIVTITEDTLAQFPYRSPIDRDFLADLLQRMENFGAKGILLDVLLDQPTESNKDKHLKDVLTQLKIPLVVSYIKDKKLLTERQTQFLDDYLPIQIRGFTNLLKDPHDGTVRWIFPGDFLANGVYLKGLSYALAEKMGYNISPNQEEIAWRGQPDDKTPPFVEYPAHLTAVLPGAWFKDKIVLIGADLTLTDLHRTPFSILSKVTDLQPRHGFGTPGILVHAHSLAQILEGRQSPNLRMFGQLAITAVAAFVGMGLALVSIPFFGLFLLAFIIVLLYWTGVLEFFYTGGPLLPFIPPTFSFLTSLWLVEIYTGRQMRQQKEFIRTAFAHYLAPTVVQQLVDNPAELSLNGERRELTFIFTDVAGFTTLSESMDPLELSNLLNLYLGGINDIILRHQGTVINFIGDAVFALFGAPVAQKDHALRAVQCVIDLDRFSEGFRHQQALKGIDFGVTRIGLHSGLATVGNMGAKTRFQYTSLGDAVNTAARLEGLNKYFSTRICISLETVLKCQESLLFRPMAKVVVKGKSIPLEVYEVVLTEQDAQEKRYLATYLKAYHFLDSKDVDNAYQLFLHLKQTRPEDPLVDFHLKRIEEGHTDIHVVMTAK
ncbi:MAG: CHASE2 domain-containing protein [Magnetococcus sp. DMHC-6]